MNKTTIKPGKIGIDRLFSESKPADKQTARTAPTAKTSETAQTAQTAKPYRVTLRFDTGLEKYIREASWAGHQTINQYLNSLIEADRAKRLRAASKG